MRNTVFQILVASSLVVLAADAIYDRFINRTPQIVYVRGGSLDVSVSGGELSKIDEVGSVGSVGSIDSLPTSEIDVNVKGGKLDYPTDFSGRLIVKPQ